MVDWKIREKEIDNRLCLSESLPDDDDNNDALGADDDCVGVDFNFECL